MNLLFAALVFIQYYGGPPMWDRRVEPPEIARPRWPHTQTGPGMECIYYGDPYCRGRRWGEDPEESWRRPRPPRYWEEEE